MKEARALSVGLEKVGTPILVDPMTLCSRAFPLPSMPSVTNALSTLMLVTARPTLIIFANIDKTGLCEQRKA